MKGKFILLGLLFHLSGVLVAEGLSWEIDSSLKQRGRILEIKQLNSGRWIFLGDEWDGGYVWGLFNLNGDMAEMSALPEGDYWGLAEKDGQWVTLKVPSNPEQKEFSLIDLQTGESFVNISEELLFGPFSEEDTDYAYTSFHFDLSPSARFLFIESRFSPGEFYYDGERYIESRAALLDLEEETIVWEKLFDSRKGEDKVRIPRFTPAYSCTFSNDEQVFLISGKETPAVLIYQNGGQVLLKNPPPEDIYLFFPDNKRILEYETMSRTSRLYNAETGERTWLDLQGLRFPCINDDGQWLVSLYDNGIDIHAVTDSGLELIDFEPYQIVLVRAEFCFIADSDIVIFSSLYSEGEIKGYRVPRDAIDWNSSGQ